MVPRRVERHGRPLDIVSILADELRLGLVDMFLEREPRLVVFRDAADSIAIEEVTRQAAVPATGAWIARVRCHVEWRRRRTLTDRAFHPADPERKAGVFKARGIQLVVRIRRVQ